MQGNITVAKSWNQLNDWQVAEIAHLYLNTPVEDFADAYLKMIFIVFPAPKEEEEEEFKPIFTKKNQPYVPFDKVIVGMSMDELQPLGKKQDVNDVRIYEFLSVLSESILYHREKAKANERK